MLLNNYCTLLRNVNLQMSVITNQCLRLSNLKIVGHSVPTIISCSNFIIAAASDIKVTYYQLKQTYDFEKILLSMCKEKNKDTARE